MPMVSCSIRTASSVTTARLSWRESFSQRRRNHFVKIALRLTFAFTDFTYISNCFLQTYEKSCEVCGKSIFTNCVESNEKFYHSECMKVRYKKMESS